MYVNMSSPHAEQQQQQQQEQQPQQQYTRTRTASSSHALTAESSMTSPPPPALEPTLRMFTHGAPLPQPQPPPPLQYSITQLTNTKPTTGSNSFFTPSHSSFAGDDIVVHGSSMGMDGVLQQRHTADTSLSIAGSSSATPNPLDKKRSFYAHARSRLLGNEPAVPSRWLNSAYRSNSFFAQRMLWVALPLSSVMAAGLGVYYGYKPHSLRLNPDTNPTSYGFLLADPRAVYTFQASPCENLVGFSALIYHTLPAVVLLALPASGWRTFEPFKRETLDSEDAEDVSSKKIKRTFVFQACELVAVCVFAFATATLLFFAYMFFNGGAFSCSASSRVHVFALVALLCFGGLIVELCYFARFREHIKMLLGAFHERDQTGDVRHHVVDAHVDQLLAKDAQVVATIRKQLFNATRANDLRAMHATLALARGTADTPSSRPLIGFPMRYYKAPHLFLGLFSQSQKNPVHVAASSGNVAALALLVQNGFELTTRDKFRRVRFSTGDLFWYFARYVIERPVETSDETAVSIFRTTLVTPLHCAVAHGQRNAVQWLLAHGADPNARAISSYRSERVPPLFVAEHPEIVRDLLTAGADQLAIPDPGFMNTLTALQLAYLRGNYAVAQELEDWGGDVALTPFHAAAAQNDALAVRRFIRAGAPVDCLGEHAYVGLNRRTPLHWAAVNGATAVVDLLLEAGANPNFQDARGRSPLHWAARLNRVACAQSLLAKGAQADLADLDALPPLTCAALSPTASRELIDLLIAHGADLHCAHPTTGDTALHVAVQREHEATALALLAAGSHVMQTNAMGLRPLDCTLSTQLQFALKRAAGQRDVMISYTHTHVEFATKLRAHLEAAHVTTWLDVMDPSGIGGGAVWREEIARGITQAAVVLCILTADYASSEWCLKELALAKQVGTPILAVSTDNVSVTDDLQVYLYTRQLVPFEPAIVATSHNAQNPKQIEYAYDNDRFDAQVRLLLDGVRDEIEKRRVLSARSRQPISSLVPSGPPWSSGRRQLSNQHQTTLSVHPMGADSSNRTHLLTIGGQYDSGRGPGALNQSHVGSIGGFSHVFAPWDATAADAQQPFVFISHGDAHPQFVASLHRALAAAGVACFGDRNVERQADAVAANDNNNTNNSNRSHGHAFERRIHAAQEAIGQCAAFLVVLSRETFASELVRDQLAFAEDKRRPIFPVVLNDLEIGLDQQYSLARSRLFHFLHGGMGFDASMNELVNGIQQQLSGVVVDLIAAQQQPSSGIGHGMQATSADSVGPSGAAMGGSDATSHAMMRRLERTNNNTVTSFVSLDIHASDVDDSDDDDDAHSDTGSLLSSDEMAFASFNFGNSSTANGYDNSFDSATGAIGSVAYTSAGVILEDDDDVAGQVYGSAPSVPLTPSSMLSPSMVSLDASQQPSDTRNFESLSSIEDGNLDLSSTRVRM